MLKVRSKLMKIKSKMFPSIASISIIRAKDLVNKSNSIKMKILSL